MHLSYQVSFIWKFLILNYKTKIITNTVVMTTRTQL